MQIDITQATVLPSLTFLDPPAKVARGNLLAGQMVQVDIFGTAWLHTPDSLFSPTGIMSHDARDGEKLHAKSIVVKITGGTVNVIRTADGESLMNPCDTPHYADAKE